MTHNENSGATPPASGGNERNDDELSDGTIVAEKAAATGAARPQPPAEGISEPTSAAAGTPTGDPSIGAPAGAVSPETPAGGAASGPRGNPVPDGTSAAAVPPGAGNAVPPGAGSAGEPAGAVPSRSPAATSGPPADAAAAAGATHPAPRKSRAGRNLPAALAVGLTLGISLIAILLFVPKVFIGVAGVAVGVATWEVAKRLREADVLVPRTPLIVGGQAVFWLGWPFGAVGVVGSFAATALACMVWRLFDHGLHTAPRNFLRDTAITVFTLAWIPLLASFAVLLLLEDPDGNLRVLTFMILVVCSDVGGYVAGVLFGRHPMVPSISPKKSWEGFCGSLVFAIIGGLLTVTLLLEANSMIGVVLGVGLVVIATLGDLIESQIKRELGIKDMGTMLPGHGGIMDRLDSMLPSAFVSWLVLSTLV